ncbi:MAG: hypothetical protein H6652_17855 [Ardenticatenaceae bacterium]|nr:hypothetical protein [Ardenticatenaceae bacterium]
MDMSAESDKQIEEAQTEEAPEVQQVQPEEMQAEDVPEVEPEQLEEAQAEEVQELQQVQPEEVLEVQLTQTEDAQPEDVPEVQQAQPEEAQAEEVQELQPVQLEEVLEVQLAQTEEAQTEDVQEVQPEQPDEAQVEDVPELQQAEQVQTEDAQTAVAETTEPDAEPDPSEAVPPPPPKKKKRLQHQKLKEDGRKAGKDGLSLRQVGERFAACGRCSYFWAGYRVIFGEEAQKTAVAEDQIAGWLYLSWNFQVPELVLKSYGVRMDIEHIHYEGTCEECRRHFIYQAPEAEDEEALFCVELSPGGGK